MTLGSLNTTTPPVTAAEAAEERAQDIHLASKHHISQYIVTSSG